jgi:hypothetical protein
MPEQTETTPAQEAEVVEETETTTATSSGEAAPNSEAELVQAAEESKKILGRFDSEEEASQTLATLEKRMNDGQSFIKQLESENALYRQALTRQLAEGQPGNGHKGTAAVTQVPTFSEADFALSQEDPEKFWNERVIPAVKGITEETARAAARDEMKTREPMLKVAEEQAKAQAIGQVWGALEQQDKRFSRNDPASSMILNQALNDFSARFGTQFNSGLIGEGEAWQYILKNASEIRNKFEGSLAKKPATVGNVVTKAKGAASGPTRKLSQQEAEAKVYDLVLQGKTQEALALKRQHGLK